MSAVIKSGTGQAVRRFERQPVGAAAPVPKPKIDPRDARIAQLEAQMADLHKALDQADSDLKRAVEDAHANGVTAGLASAEHCELDRLEAVRAALNAADKRFETALTTLEFLAPQLARAALDKMFGTIEDWAPIVETMLARQLATLRRTSVVSIRVSPTDFADPETLAALASSNLRAVIDPDLHAGAARIDCKLGQIDLDARAQWRALATLLDEMTA